MTIKHIGFADSIVMKEFEKIAKEKNWVKSEPKAPAEEIKKEASSKEPELVSTGNFFLDAITLANVLRNRGFIRQAQLVEDTAVDVQRNMAQEKAENLYNFWPETGESLLDHAHKNTTYDVAGSNELAKFEDANEVQKKMMDSVKKNPSGKDVKIESSGGNASFPCEDIQAPAQPAQFGCEEVKSPVVTPEFREKAIKAAMKAMAALNKNAQDALPDLPQLPATPDTAKGTGDAAVDLVLQHRKIYDDFANKQNESKGIDKLLSLNLIGENFSIKVADTQDLFQKLDKDIDDLGFLNPALPGVARWLRYFGSFSKLFYSGSEQQFIAAAKEKLDEGNFWGGPSSWSDDVKRIAQYFNYVAITDITKIDKKKGDPISYNEIMNSNWLGLGANDRAWAISGINNPEIKKLISWVPVLTKEFPNYVSAYVKNYLNEKNKFYTKVTSINNIKDRAGKIISNINDVHKLYGAMIVGNEDAALKSVLRSLSAIHGFDFTSSGFVGWENILESKDIGADESTIASRLNQIDNIIIQISKKLETQKPNTIQKKDNIEFDIAKYATLDPNSLASAFGLGAGGATTKNTSGGPYTGGGGGSGATSKNISPAEKKAQEAIEQMNRLVAKFPVAAAEQKDWLFELPKCQALMNKSNDPKTMQQWSQLTVAALSELKATQNISWIKILQSLHPEFSKEVGQRYHYAIENIKILVKALSDLGMREFAASARAIRESEPIDSLQGVELKLNDLQSLYHLYNALNSRGNFDPSKLNVMSKAPDQMDAAQKTPQKV